jgi:hypothetical protein
VGVGRLPPTQSAAKWPDSRRAAWCWQTAPIPSRRRRTPHRLAFRCASRVARPTMWSSNRSPLGSRVKSVMGAARSVPRTLRAFPFPVRRLGSGKAGRTCRTLPAFMEPRESLRPATCPARDRAQSPGPTPPETSGCLAAMMSAPPRLRTATRPRATIFGHSIRATDCGLG